MGNCNIKITVIKLCALYVFEEKNWSLYLIFVNLANKLRRQVELI